MNDTDRVKVVVVGASGHARVCLEALRDDPRHTILGVVSRDGEGPDDLGTTVLGTDRDLLDTAQRVGADAICVAIGDNRTRAAISTVWSAAGGHFATAISRFAMVSHTAVIGEGSVILPGAVLNAAARIGTGGIVNTAASVDHDCLLGDYVHIAPGVALGGGVQVGDRTFVGLGARVIPGVRLGADVTVGAGAVVLHDVPDGGIVVGVPARPLERSRDTAP